MSYTSKHGGFIIPLLFILLHSPLPATAQTNDPNNESVSYARFSPPLAIILAILVAVLFFIGLFSIFIRNRSDNNTNGSIVNVVTGRSRRNTRGLEASVLETFPTMVYSEVKIHKIGKGALECAVCLNEFEDDETLRLIPNCDHVFHTECIDAWLASHTTCPVCRANLASQPNDSEVSQPVELNNTAVDIDLEGGDSEREEERRLNNNVNVSSDVFEAQVVQEVDLIELNRTLNKNRTRGSRSSLSRKFFYPRSHSTGHSMIQPGQNTDRFTLRLPVNVRNQLITRELTRATSLVLPKESSTRPGYLAGDDGGSSRGKSFTRVDKTDRRVKSDRWLFSKSLSFFNRASSMKSPKVAGNNGEGTSSSVGPVVESSRSQV